MLLKSKICLTILAVYEMIAISFLHFKRICDAMFSTMFCDGWYRYFLFCVIVPLVIGLILMWIREIVRAHRRRRFFRRTRKTINNVVSAIRGRVSEQLDMNDMERIVTAAVLVGIKKYADSHPGLRHSVNHIMDVARGDAEIDIMATDEEDIKSSRAKKVVKSKTKK